MSRSAHILADHVTCYIPGYSLGHAPSDRGRWWTWSAAGCRVRWGVEYVLSAAEDQRTRSCISISHDFWHILLMSERAERRGNVLEVRSTTSLLMDWLYSFHTQQCRSLLENRDEWRSIGWQRGGRCDLARQNFGRRERSRG